MTAINPNIFVNGDAGLIHVLDFNHQCHVKQTGSLQEQVMRQEVWQVMEGTQRHLRGSISVWEASVDAATAPRFAREFNGTAVGKGNASIPSSATKNFQIN